MAVLGAAAAVSSPAFAAPAPVDPLLLTRAQTEPAVLGAHIRALEARTESRAARLGLSASPARALPAVPHALAERAGALLSVERFLAARREVLRSRMPGRVTARGRPDRPVSPRAAVVRQAARLGLSPPAPARPASGPVAALNRQRMRDIALWLSTRSELLRDIEQPLIWPVDGAETSPFGVRWGRMHEGIDLDGEGGDPIHVAAGGIVVFAGSHSGYGNLVVVRHGGGLDTAYAHLSAIATSSGRAVVQGAVIGRMGSIGHSTGTHLHFETRFHGQAVDPRAFLPRPRRAGGVR